VVTSTGHMPLILQHDGHSRSVVGYEISKTGTVNLLVFDPSRLPNRKIREAGIELHSTSTSSSPSPATSASKTLQSLNLNGIHTSSSRSQEGHKRTFSSTSNASQSPPKRARSGNKVRIEQSGEVTDGWVTEDDDDGDENKGGDKEKSSHREHGKNEDEMTPSQVLKFFRLDHAKLKKNKEYQILYFTLREPLSDGEKMRMKVVQAERVC